MKHLKRLAIALIILFLIFFTILLIYTRNPYTALDAMYDNINDSNITVTENVREFVIEPANYDVHIILIPGGLVEADAYLYLATELANLNYKVTLYKAPFYLSLLTSNYPSKYIEDDKTNIVVGHSMGGVSAAFMSSENNEIDGVVLMASYSTVDLTQSTLLIFGENDTVINNESYENSKTFYDDYDEVIIENGNHGQFGWYGFQKGDTEVSLSTLEQQNLIIDAINQFIIQLSQDLHK